MIPEHEIMKIGKSLIRLIVKTYTKGLLEKYVNPADHTHVIDALTDLVEIVAELIGYRETIKFLLDFNKHMNTTRIKEDGENPVQNTNDSNASEKS